MTYSYGIKMRSMLEKYRKALFIMAAGLFLAATGAATLGAGAVDAPNWTVEPGSQIDFTCLSGGSFVHTLETVVQGEGGNFSGTGYYNPDNGYTWDIDGNISGDTFEFTVEYTNKAAGTIYNATNGVISSDGSATADVDGNCTSLSMAAGSFSAFEVPETEVNIYGDTGAENVPGVWMFERDQSSSTTHEFVSGVGTLGEGSLFAGPITNTKNDNSDKFIAEYFAREKISDFDSLSYDFKIAGAGDTDDDRHFYVNFYTTVNDGTKFYDCRFDFVPTIGSTIDFTTFEVNFDDVASATRAGGGLTGGCPSSKLMTDMPEGSYIRAIAISMGDTSATDQDLEGYFDRVVYSTVYGVTTYDFEPYPAVSTKTDCKNEGWMRGLSYENQSAFRNQGDCVSYFATMNSAVGQNPPQNGNGNDRNNRNRR